MARPDGRIEKGQRLSSAISARAWNRAQEAADRVLGAGTGFQAESGQGYPSFLAMPMRITGTAMLADNKFPPGAVVRLSGLATPRSATSAPVSASLSPPYDGYMTCDVGIAAIHDPYTSLNTYTNGSAGDPWGVTTQGGTINDVVPVIVRGVAPVRIRLLYYATQATNRTFAVPTVRRSQAETVERLRGVLETTACACDNAARVLGVARGGTASGGPENAETAWGVVIL